MSLELLQIIQIGLYYKNNPWTNFLRKHPWHNPKIFLQIQPFISTSLYNLYLRACTEGDLDIVQKTVQLHPEFIETDYHDGLSSAAQYGHIPVVQYIIDRFGDQYKLDAKTTALIRGCEYSQYDLVHHLISAVKAEQGRVGLQILYSCLYDLPLKGACKSGDLRMIEYLIDNDFPIGEFAFHRACLDGKLDVIKYLVFRMNLRQGQKGVYKLINSSDNYALIWSCHQGHFEVVKYLVETGAELHAQHEQALCLACEQGYFEIVKYLVEAGANIRIDNNKPLHQAYKKGRFRIVQYLVDKGCKFYTEQTDI